MIKHLLVADLTKRYGNLKGGWKALIILGVGDIKGHRWFKGIDWVNLVNKKLAAPYKPVVR